MDREQMSELLYHWIKSPGELHHVLRDVQIKLLFDRLVLRQTYAELSVVFHTSPGKIRQIFEALIMRIERIISKKLGKLLRDYSNELDKQSGTSKGHHFEFSRIYLN